MEKSKFNCYVGIINRKGELSVVYKMKGEPPKPYWSQLEPGLKMTLSRAKELVQQLTSNGLNAVVIQSVNEIKQLDNRF